MRKKGTLIQPERLSSTEVLLDAFRDLLQACDIDSVSRVVSHAARRVVGADGATLVLRDGDACHYIDEDAIAPLWKGRRFPASACVSGLAMAEGQPITIPDVFEDVRVPHDLYAPTFVRSLVLVPCGQPAVAAIGAYWAMPHSATASELSAMTRLAEATGIAVINLRTATRLAESERRFRLMADSTPVMIWVHNKTGKLEFVNRAWLEFFDVTEDRARDDLWQPLVHEDDREHYVSTFIDCLGRGVPFHAEARVQRADGEWRWISSYGAPRLNDDGTCSGMVGSSADVTELKAASTEVEESARRKERWIAVVGHELRQPVHAIHAALRMLRPDAPRAAQDRARAVVTRQVSQMSRILEDLLDAARIVRGEVSLDLRVVDLREVLAEGVDAVANPFEGKSQTIMVNAPPDPVLVRVDAQRMQQVIGNLLSNASKYSALGDRVVASIAVDGTHAELTVSDAGRGIDPAVLPRIFELFASFGGDGSSYGVGLAISRRLVELQGGTLVGSSDGSGLGSRFVVRLPVAREGRVA